MEKVAVKVAIFENAIGFGGSTVCAEQLVRGCLAAGGDPYLVLSYESDRLSRHMDDDHVRRLYQSRLWQARKLVKSTSDGGGGIGKAAVRNIAFAATWYGCEWPTAIRVSRWLRFNKIDIVHANNDLLNNRLAILAGRLAGIPVISHQRGRQWPGRFSRRLSRGVSRFVAISDFISTDLRDTLGDSSNVVRIYDGVSIPSKQDENKRDGDRCRTKWSIPAGRTVFGFPGMFVKWKGHSLFLEAFARIVKKHPDVHALIVGGDPLGGSEAATELRQIAADLNISDRVTFTGPVERIDPYLEAMDVVVHASTEPEPLGLTVLEAMAAGKPVIAADSGGPAETVVPGETGLLFETGNVESLTACMASLLDSQNNWSDMGDKGRNRVALNFSHDRNQEAITQLYADVSREHQIQTGKGSECHSRPCYS